MTVIQTNKQLWGKDFPIGGEWDAGNTPPHTPHDKSARWTVRREQTRFVVVFHRFHDHQESILDEFPPVDEGEIEAKTCAVHMRNIHQTIPIPKQGV